MPSSSKPVEAGAGRATTTITTEPTASWGREGIPNRAGAGAGAGAGDIINSNIVHNKYHKRPIKSWARGIIIRQACHSKLATSYTQMDNRLNTLSVTLTALSSSAVFATINPTVDMTLNGIPNSKNYLAWGAGLIALASTVLQAIVKALNYATLAEQHRMATSQFTRLRFRLELVVGDHYVDDGNLNMEKLAEWTREYEDLLESTPVIPQDIFAKQRKLELNAECKWQKEMDEYKEEKIALHAPQLSKIEIENESTADGDEELGNSPKKASVVPPSSASEKDDFPFTILKGDPTLRDADDTDDDNARTKEKEKYGSCSDEKTSLIPRHD